MERNLLPESISEHAASIRTRARRGEKGNAVSDSQILLKLYELKGFDFQFSIPGIPIPDKPTLVVANHYCRSLDKRVNPSTTDEIQLTTAAVTVAVNQATDKQVSWAAQEDLRTKFWFLRLKGRETQLAAIKVYDFIPVKKSKRSKNRKKEENVINPLRECAKRLEQNCLVCVYPEGKVGSFVRPGILRKHDRAFPFFIRELDHSGIDFQLLPASIFSKEKTYTIVVGKPFEPLGSSVRTAEYAMAMIAQNLPEHLKGHYALKSTSATTGK